MCRFVNEFAKGTASEDFDFSQSDIPGLREQMCYELATGSLVD
jgi:hypothetical protein